MSDPSLIARDLNRLIDQAIARRFAQAFGGVPGVYNNVSLTIDRTGAIRFASGGGEVAFNWNGGSAGNGTIDYVAPYRMVFGTASIEAGDGSVAYSVSVGGTGAFAGTAVPMLLQRGDVVRLICTGLSGTAAYHAVTLVRDFAGTAFPLEPAP